MARPATARVAIGRLARPIVALLAFALAAWAAGCEVFIDGKLYVVACEDEGAVGPPACLDGFECKAGVCVQVLSRPLGDACGGDADCDARDLCLPAAVFGDHDRTCARPCCSSSDCDPERLFVCAAPPDGGPRFCRPASSVGLTVTGFARAGDLCDAPADCRSGRCDHMTGACADACCSDAGCGQGTGACRLDGPTGAEKGFACAPPALMGLGRYEPCKQDGDCASGLCVVLEGGASRCSSPCCSSATCGTVDAGDAPRPVACAHVMHEGELIRACSVLLSGKANLPVGAPCGDDLLCRSGQCLASGECSDACCRDDDCGDASVFQCRPGPKEDQWALRCERK